MPPDVLLKLDRNVYGGWTSVRITRGMEQLAGTFALELTDKWSLDATAIQIRAGMACQILIAETPVITGWIDKVDVQHDASTHVLRVQGRDKAGDLVDCAAVHASQEWAGRTLAQVAADLLAPFGMGVRAESDTGAPFRYTHAEQGETVHELLARGAALRGVLVVSDSATGELVFTRAGSQRSATVLQLGDNILAGSSGRNQRERFSSYRVVGQQRESDTLAPRSAATSAATVNDTGLDRYRPTVIHADGAANIAECQTRARWERSQRIAQSQRAEITVRGWLDDDAPWLPNTLVTVRDRWLGLDGEYLIAVVTYSIGDDAGAITRLSVVPPDAYDVLAEKETDPAGDVALYRDPEPAEDAGRGITFGRGS